MGGPCLGLSQASSQSDSGTQQSVLCSGVRPPTPMLPSTPGEVRGWRACRLERLMGDAGRLCRLLQLSPRAPCPLAVLSQSGRRGDQPSGDFRVPAPAQ